MAASVALLTIGRPNGPAGFRTVRFRPGDASIDARDNHFPLEPPEHGEHPEQARTAGVVVSRA
jgi:hypothetical protein